MSPRGGFVGQAAQVAWPGCEAAGGPLSIRSYSEWFVQEGRDCVRSAQAQMEARPAGTGTGTCWPFHSRVGVGVFCCRPSSRRT